MSRTIKSKGYIWIVTDGFGIPFAFTAKQRAIDYVKDVTDGSIIHWDTDGEGEAPYSSGCRIASIYKCIINEIS